MSPRLAQGVVVASLLLVSQQAGALGVGEVVCPGRLEPDAAVPKGWKRYDPAPITVAAGSLEGIAIYTTSPEDGFRPLAPEQAPSDTTADTWYVRRGPGGGPGLYVACRYAGTTSLLFQALPPGLNECVAPRAHAPDGSIKVACNSRR